MDKVEELVFYESILVDMKQALADGRITDDEYNKLVSAIHKGRFKNDQDPRPDLDPIIDKIWQD